MPLYRARLAGLAAGTDGLQKDLAVYEHVAAFAESGSEHRQVLIGTLVKVGDGWRVIEGPAPMPEGTTDVSTLGVFFRPRQSAEPRPQVVGNAPSEKSQQLLSIVEKLDAAINKATSKSPPRWRGAPPSWPLRHSRWHRHAGNRICLSSDRRHSTAGSQTVEVHNQ